jgi:hypothetical protein
MYTDNALNYVMNDLFLTQSFIEALLIYCDSIALSAEYTLKKIQFILPPRQMPQLAGRLPACNDTKSQNIVSNEDVVCFNLIVPSSPATFNSKIPSMM